MSVSSRAVEAWSWITVMSGSSRAFGLDLEERLDVWICRRCWSKGPLGLDLRWTDDERWCFLQGSSGLDLELVEVLQGAVGAWSWRWIIVEPMAVGAWSWKNDERRTKKAFLILRELGCLRASEFQSFRASRILPNDFGSPQMNEIGFYL